MKVASVWAVSARFADDLYFDVGGAATGALAPQELGRQLFERWLAHASGHPTCSEALGLGGDEFVPWPVGVLA